MGEFIMNYVISTDACADMPVGYEKEHDIPIVPMPYSLKMPKGTPKKLDFIGKANTEFGIVECRTDTTGFIQNMKKFFDTLRTGAIPKTSQSNAEITFETLEPYVKAGNDVLHIAFSSGMSGSFNSACIAATELMEKYPGRTVKVVDSLGGVGGEGLCVMDAVKLRDEGVSLEDAHKKLTEYAPRYHHYFTVGDKAYLARSGRISGIEYMFAILLNIQIILGLDGEGKIYPAAKVRGTKNVYKKFLELFETEKGDEDNSEIILCHGDNPDGIKLLGEMMTEKFPEIKKIDYNYVNQMVGSNSGPDSLALFFRGKPRAIYKK